MKKTSVIILAILAMFLSACEQGQANIQPAETVSPEIVNIVTQTEQPTIATTPTNTQIPVNTRTRYELTAVLDYAYERLNVDGSVTYTNRSTKALSDLILVVEPNLTYGVFTLTALTWEDGSEVEGETLDRHKLTIPLRENLEPGKSVRVNFSYSLYLPNNAGVLCMNETQVNLSGWYPYAAPYIEGTGWVVNDPGYVGEYQVYELADFTVDIRIDGAPADFVVAASTRSTNEDGWYHFSQENVRNFTWSGSNYYHMLEAYAGDIRVRAFVFLSDLDAGQASLETTVQALDLYASLFGPYMHDSLTIVEAGFTDGMEYDGLYYLGQEYFNSYTGTPDSYLTAISAHETAHDWWYGMVTNDQAYDPWLDEAICIYSELLFYEHYYPELVDWWWTNRVNYFEPQGWVDSSIYEYSSFRIYVNAVYLRGAQAIGEIRGQVGDEAFFAFMRNYFIQMHERADNDHLGLATAEDFWRILGETSDADLSAIRTTYFSQP